ncbi:hypothetical protein [uncultured Sneathiella sp.]|uniref:hypothetical protein n=1 Tax=uncultured Sneathiella sp. TaxID=879315 RepID=UPI002596B24E|nr:hypothetical protein [uncultured Sneathiella sp.]
MTGSTPFENASEREHLKADEIVAAFNQLASDELLKLTAIEVTLLSGTGLAKGDLLNEAVCRALSGQRKCPRKVSFMAFIVETMKSIASHAREKHSMTDVTDAPSEAANIDGTYLSSIPSPEETLISKSIIEEIYDLFKDDEEATLVIIGWADGLRGKALREETGLNQAKLDYAKKRIRTRMNERHPNGIIR